MNARIVALIVAIMGMLVASGIPASNGRGAPLPTLSILSPTPNEVIGNGTPVAIVFAVTNFNLTEPGNGTSSPNSGHVDVFVNDTRTAQSSVNTIVLPLPSGPHTIRLRLVTDNGSALNPDVTASVSVMVTRGPAGGTPGLSIVFPREGARVHGQRVEVQHIVGVGAPGAGVHAPLVQHEGEVAVHRPARAPTDPGRPRGTARRALGRPPSSRRRSRSASTSVP